MIFEDFFAALALIFVIEGMFLFLSPVRWREYVQSIATQPSRTLRTVGFISMLMGTGVLYIVKHWSGLGG